MCFINSKWIFCKFDWWISNDPVGKFVKEKLKEYGIGIKYLYETDGRMKTSLALAEIRRKNVK